MDQRPRPGTKHCEVCVILCSGFFSVYGSVTKQQQQLQEKNHPLSLTHTHTHTHTEINRLNKLNTSPRDRNPQTHKQTNWLTVSETSLCSNFSTADGGSHGRVQGPFKETGPPAERHKCVCVCVCVCACVCVCVSSHLQVNQLQVGVICVFFPKIH